MNIPGIISVVDGGSDPFKSVLPNIQPSGDVEAKGESPDDAPSEPKPVNTSVVDTAEKNVPPKKGVGFLLSESLKEKGLNIGDVDESTDLDAFISKISNYIDSSTTSKAESIYGKDVLDHAKLLSSGLSLEDRSELARLNVLANFKYEITDSMSEDEKTALSNDAKEVISEYYRDTLKGAALERAINGIDEYDDLFVKEYETASEHFKEKRDAFKAAQLNKVKEQEEATSSYEKEVRKAIESGELYGTKRSKEEIALDLKNVYEPTEEIIENGEKKKVSKYYKMYKEIQKNPLLGARIAVAVAEGLDFKTAKNIGKGDFTKELEKEVYSAMDFGRKQEEGVGFVKGMPKMKGIVEVLQ